MMHRLFALALIGTLVQDPLPSGLHNATIDVDEVGPMTYGIWVPRDYDAAEPVPLVLALHPGGSPGPGYGMQFLRGVVGPALQAWGGVIVAPDVSDRRWTNPASERAVLELIDDVRARYSIDPERILITGFSMGGRGTWFLATRHPDLFTAAIPMAARAEDDATQVGDMPVYIIHARDDEVVPFEPAERLSQDMAARGQTVAFKALEGVGHFRMGAAPLQEAGEWVLERWAER